MNPIYSDPSELIKRKTKLLILDYDVSRFHSFDLFRYLMLDHSYFIGVDPKYLEMVSNHKPIAEQVDFYRSTCSSINPFDYFIHTADKIHTSELDRQMNLMFQNPRAAITGTDLSQTLYQVICSSTLDVHWIHYQNDPYVPEFSIGTSIIIGTVNEMFKPREIASYIAKNGINSLIVSSIEFAILIIGELLHREYYNPMTILVCKYNYNYQEFDFKGAPMKALKCSNQIFGLQNKLQYEFGVLDTYTSISQNKRILAEQG